MLENFWSGKLTLFNNVMSICPPKKHTGNEKNKK